MGRRPVLADANQTIALRRALSLPGFGPATHLMTPEGEMPVEWLATGDRVLTRDHGAQPVLWIGRQRIQSAHAKRIHEARPFDLAAGALAPDCPTHPTLLSPGHRVLLSGAMVELHMGTDEVLAQIAHLEDGAHVGRSPAAATHYTHVLLPMHELVLANGLWAETLHLTPEALDLLGDDIPREILARPGLSDGHERAARMSLADWEVQVLVGSDRGLVPELIRRSA